MECSELTELGAECVNSHVDIGMNGGQNCHLGINQGGAALCASNTDSIFTSMHLNVFFFLMVVSLKSVFNEAIKFFLPPRPEHIFNNLIKWELYYKAFLHTKTWFFCRNALISVVV